MSRSSPDQEGRRTRRVERRFFEPGRMDPILMHEEVAVHQGRRPTRRTGFTMVWLEKLLELPPMPWTAMRTLAALTQFHNPQTGTIRYKLGEIGQITGDPIKQNVWRSIQTLIETGVVIRIQTGEVMLNPNFAWIGDEQSQERARRRMALLAQGIVDEEDQ